jgi:hypothetical protein
MLQKAFTKAKITLIKSSPSFTKKASLVTTHQQEDWIG